MLALGDTVKSLLKGLANTKDINLAHLDYDEDIDNMIQIAHLVKKQASKEVMQTTLIQVDEVGKKKAGKTVSVCRTLGGSYLLYFTFSHCILLRV